MTTISRAQLEPKQLERLAAQRRLYGDAKTLQALHIMLSVPAVIAWSVAVAFWPDLKVGSAAWGIAISLADVFFFTRRQKDVKNRAAKIQELFDCDVLDLPWNNLKLGRHPDPEAVVEAAERHKRRDAGLTKLRDWYPPAVDHLSLAVARIVCQRANVWWDAELRRRYASWVVGCVSMLCAIVIAFSLYGEFSFEKFILAGAMPLMPAILLAIRQVRDNSEAAQRADELKRHAESLWHKAIGSDTSEDELTSESRHLQDEIYSHRRQSPLIFDWIYTRLEKCHEVQMNRGAEFLVEEALKALATRKRRAGAGANG